jgi:Bacterial regulatory proteins, luxR family
VVPALAQRHGPGAGAADVEDLRVLRDAGAAEHEVVRVRAVLGVDRVGAGVQVRDRAAARVDERDRAGGDEAVERGPVAVRRGGEEDRDRGEEDGEGSSRPKTVEYHLGKVFRKLGVRSRTELADLLATEVRS